MEFAVGLQRKDHVLSFQLGKNQKKALLVSCIRPLQTVLILTLTLLLVLELDREWLTQSSECVLGTLTPPHAKMDNWKTNLVTSLSDAELVEDVHGDLPQQKRAPFLCADGTVDSVLPLGWGAYGITM